MAARATLYRTFVVAPRYVDKHSAKFLAASMNECLWLCIRTQLHTVTARCMVTVILQATYSNATSTRTLLSFRFPPLSKYVRLYNQKLYFYME